jgi:glycosyltransferase involved in cell wall biosynthesis
MKISIALTSFNGERFLQEQLDSFKNQSIQPDELIVCDDCSEDKTISILQKFKDSASFDTQIYQNETNVGLTRNFEKAISLCSGDIIFLSDQDDVWFNEKIEIILNVFKDNESIDAVMNDAYYSDELLQKSPTTVLEKAAYYAGSDEGHLAGACTAFRRRFQQFLLPFPTSCPPYDIYIHRWTWLLSNKMILKKPLQVWRIHDDNGSSYSEMASPEIESLFVRYWKQRHIRPYEVYENRADQYTECKDQLLNRGDKFAQLPKVPEVDELLKKLDEIISANKIRARLIKSQFFPRFKLIILMIRKNYYKYFKGIQSIAKDILR